MLAKVEAFDIARPKYGYIKNWRVRIAGYEVALYAYHV